MSKSEWSPEAPSANRHIESVWLGQAFLDEFILVYPVYAIMMLDAGLSAMELSILFAIWSLSALQAEIVRPLGEPWYNQTRPSATSPWSYSGAPTITSS